VFRVFQLLSENKISSKTFPLFHFGIFFPRTTATNLAQYTASWWKNVSDPIQIPVLRIGDSCKALSVAVMDVSIPKLQEYFRQNMFGSHNNNNNDWANEEVKETQKVNDLHDGNK
jgi:hypothetical protein